MNKNKVMMIGIAGGTGSGKTTLTDKLAAEFAPHITVLKHDDYYKSRDELTYEERTKINYDEPAAFDNDLFMNQLMLLRDGKSIESPIYDYTEHNRSKKTRLIEPNKVFIIEGILIFADKRLTDLFDIKIFVDTDADIRLIRRIKRDVKERGRTLDSVIEQYETTVKPMHEIYVQPSRKKADIVVLDGGKNAVALDMIKSRIESHLK